MSKCGQDKNRNTLFDRRRTAQRCLGTINCNVPLMTKRKVFILTSWSYAAKDWWPIGWITSWWKNFQPCISKTAVDVGRKQAILLQNVGHTKISVSYLFKLGASGRKRQVRASRTSKKRATVRPYIYVILVERYASRQCSSLGNMSWGGGVMLRFP